MSSTVNSSSEYVTSTPIGAGNLRLEYDSWVAGGGCEGLAIRAVATAGGDVVPIMVKQFYRNSNYDDGEPFTQDPDKKAEESYEAFQYLQTRGFKVPPYFALGISPEDHKVLLMTDLSRVGELEVYDEKAMHRNSSIEYTLDGKEVKGRVDKMLDGLVNRGDVYLDMLLTGLLQRAHSVYLGNGVAHLIVRDPQTNTGEAFVLDVGEFSKGGGKYREAINAEEAVAVPYDEILETYQCMLDAHHPGLSAAELFERAQVTEPRRRLLQDAWYQSAVGLALREHVGGMVQDVAWAQKQFARINFGEHFLKVKLDLHRTARSFNKHYGAPLNEVDEASVKHFINPESVGDLLVGLDLAYQAVADSRVRHAMIMRKAVDANQAVIPYTSSISFSDTNLPHLEFFDNYYENRGDTCRVSIYGQRKAELENYQLELELDWDTGYRAETHGGRPGILVLPEQIKKIGVVHWHGPKETIVDQTDFDPSKLAIIAIHGTIEAGATLSYHYEGEVVYVHTIEDSDDRLVIAKIIKNKEAITNRVFA